MKGILTKYKLNKSKREQYNLKRLLTKAKFTSNDQHAVKNATDLTAASAFICSKGTH